MDTTLQDPLVGHVLDGRYRVESRIAAGGMATVYRAMDTRLDRVLALKVMHPGLAADGAFVDRFIREAKSVARLAHPNVVNVFDQGTDGTYVYLAMEYIAGCTLRDVLRERGALQPRAALDILEPILAALGAAHLAGLVHRDMKPENVLIGDDGRVKVADFGLVRTVDNNSTSSTGSVLGTVSYLAPEQIEHGTADTRADVYACGVVLYEMLTGSKPHSGGSPAQILYQHLHDDVPPVSDAVPGCAGRLDHLVTLATARDPQLRPDDAVALLSHARAVRSELTDAQLDAVPPQALTASQDGSEDRTSVIPRALGVQPPLPGMPDGGADEAAQNRTSRLVMPVPPPAGPPPGPRGPVAHRRRMPGRGVVTIVVAVLLALGVGTGVWYINSGQFTSVPRVLRLSQADAEKAVRGAGLDVKVKRDFSGNVARGQVMDTDPDSDARIRNTGTVTIVVSRGPEIVKIPDLSGTPLADAKRELRQRGLVPGTVKRAFDDEVAKGSVIGTDPRAGAERKPDSAVALTVSRGEEIEVPDVTGDAVEDARTELAESGLKTEVAAEKVFSEEDKGAVAVQSPSEGDTLGKGDTVTLTVSKGEQMVEVPDVEGTNVDDAKAELREAGFDVSVTRFFFGDTVFDQSVDGGEEAPKGSTITLRVR
ncbi:Stk1 family PASTA domain-containing Ser/Thr kinase [Streptomyces sp. H27-D2]|uniref:Stk1 family PASTA domain-containing Ser/Thr kinase n=1 Tax=Streptomyces sp. H27-D2 TaxID=3046304 RepID=UPI002DBC52FB|nr:Stk1 family PASTA domain-containing Ser/Thr kinase [Streptomyces sp. H27-D2]MEC4018943.1 Stk1 family PASTA domain-containing Ser/Thr kinase [Streptomyces sp. H27-D2]